MKIFQRIIFALSVMTVFIFICYTQENNYKWEAIAMGGSGFINAVIPSRTGQGLFYTRTEDGGAYCWDETEEMIRSSYDEMFTFNSCDMQFLY